MRVGVVDSMRRVAVIALLIVSEHVAASNIWLEASREVVTGWSRIEKGMTWRISGSIQKNFCLLTVVAGCRHYITCPREVWL